MGQPQILSCFGAFLFLPCLPPCVCCQDALGSQVMLPGLGLSVALLAKTG